MSAAGASRSFRFVARDPRGRRTSSTLTAADEGAALAELRRQGLHPVSLEAADVGSGAAQAPALAGEASPKKAGPAQPPRGTLSLVDQAALTEALARLIEQKITPDRALLIISRGRTGKLAQAAAAIRSEVRAGKALADAMSEAGALADPAAAALIKAGDVSGDVGAALGTASRLLNGRLASRRQLVSGLIYPSVLVTVSLASILLVLVGIIPQFLPLVADRMEMVPPLGRVVFAVSDVLARLWPVLLLGLLLACAAGLVLARSGRLGHVLVRLGRRVPLVGRMLADNETMLTLRILGMLLERRLPLDRALAVLGGTVADLGRRARVETATRRVERGDPLADAFEAEGLLPPSAIEMMRIGEETATLSTMLLRAADDFEASANRQMSRVLLLIEPALVVLVGGIIGVSLYALFTAITAVNATAF